MRPSKRMGLACLLLGSAWRMAGGVRTAQRRAVASEVCPAVAGSYGPWGVGTAPNSSQQTNEEAGPQHVAAANDVCTACSSVALPLCSCPAGYMCAEGPNYPQCQLCPPGHYCPHPGTARALRCPGGHFCPEGAWLPLECSAAAYCPAGTARAIDWSLLVWALAVGLTAALLPAFKRACRLGPGQGGTHRPDRTRAIVDMHFDDITYHLPNKGWCQGGMGQQLLRGVSGWLHGGDLVAVMGPSGAGKSTLLSVLLGRLQPTGGQVLVNGQKADFAALRQVIGYVPQDDVMHRDLTVEENLLHSAQSRLPGQWTAPMRSARVHDVISTLGLAEVRHRVVGDELSPGISGGQRKRVNIGLELVADCSLLFLDEPTSGLDATASSELMECLRKIKGQGLSVCCVVHQPRPEVYTLFDSVLLLGPGGYGAYFGPPRSAPAHFEACGISVDHAGCWPDHCMDLLAVLPPEAFKRMASKSTCERACSQQGTERASPRQQGYWARLVSALRPNRSAAPFLRQLATCMRQYTLQWAHRPSRLLLHALLAALAGAYVALAFPPPHYRLPLSPVLTSSCPMGLRQLEASGGQQAGDQTMHGWCAAGLPAHDQAGQLALYVGMGLGVVATSMAVPTFAGTVRLVQHRERLAGTSTCAFVLGRMAVDCAGLLLLAGCTASALAAVAAPTAPYPALYGLVYMHVFCMYGVGYVAGACLGVANANLAAVVVGIVWMITSGFVFSATDLGVLGDLSFPRWFGEGLYGAQVQHMVDTSVPGEVPTGAVAEGIRQYAARRYGYELGRLGYDVGMMAAGGVALRLAALLALRYLPPRH